MDANNMQEIIKQCGISAPLVLCDSLGSNEYNIAFDAFGNSVNAIYDALSVCGLNPEDEETIPDEDGELLWHVIVTLSPRHEVSPTQRYTRHVALRASVSDGEIVEFLESRGVIVYGPDGVDEDEAFNVAREYGDILGKLVLHAKTVLNHGIMLWIEDGDAKDWPALRDAFIETGNRYALLYVNYVDEVSKLINFQTGKLFDPNPQYTEISDESDGPWSTVAIRARASDFYFYKEGHEVLETVWNGCVEKYRGER